MSSGSLLAFLNSVSSGSLLAFLNSVSSGSLLAFLNSVSSGSLLAFLNSVSSGSLLAFLNSVSSGSLLAFLNSVSSGSLLATGPLSSCYELPACPPIAWINCPPEKLETLPAGTKPRTSQHRSPGGERRGQRKRLRHYPRSQSQGHHSIDHQDERGLDRGNARRSSLKGRERAIVNQITRTLEPFQRWGNF